MSAATNYTELLTLKYLFTADNTITRPTAWYVGLFTAAPSDTGGGTEVSGGSYSRQQVTAWTVATAGDGTTTAKNTNTITFTTATASWGTITHLGVFTASTSGTLLFYGAVSPNKVIDNGDTFQITVENLSIELQ